MTESLESVLGGFEGEAGVLRLNGHIEQAKAYLRVVDEIRKAMAPYLDKLTEDEARSRSGRSVSWLRAQHAIWCEEGLAGWDGKRRWYRRIVVPRRVNLEAIQSAAKRAAMRRAS